jgi:hypothetical protein
MSDEDGTIPLPHSSLVAVAASEAGSEVSVGNTGAPEAIIVGADERAPGADGTGLAASEHGASDCVITMSPFRGEPPAINADAPSAEDAQRAHLEAIFASIDANGDGQLSAAEVIKAVRANPLVAQLIGLADHNVRQEDGSRDEFERVFQEIDRDQNRKLDRSEFVAYFLRLLHGQQSSAIVAGAASSCEVHGIAQRPLNSRFKPPTETFCSPLVVPHAYSSAAPPPAANVDDGDSVAQACATPARPTVVLPILTPPLAPPNVPTAVEIASAHATLRRLSELEAEVQWLRTALADERACVAADLRGVRMREAELHAERSRQRKHEEECRAAEREAEAKAREALVAELLVQRALVARQDGQLRSVSASAHALLNGLAYHTPNRM